MAFEVTSRAKHVLKRALDVGRMHPSSVGVRISVATGLRGDEVRTGFAENAEPGETTIDVDGIRLFVPIALYERGAIVDVADEHDRIILR